MADETGQAEVFPVAHSPHAHQLQPCSGYALVIRRNRPCPTAILVAVSSLSLS